MNGEISVVDDVADAFARLVIDSYANRTADAYSLVLSGGPTARRCYERLAVAGADEIGWWDVDVYWGDERCVPPDSPDSNELLVRQTLLEKVGAVNAIYPMRCDEGPEAYQLRVAHLDSFDLVHLGLGPDGHTASLFPESPGLNADPGQLVVFNSDPSGTNPHRRMTLTLAGLAKSRHVVFTVSGESKRAAFSDVCNGVDVPAARVTADRITWLVDHEALRAESP